MISTLNRASIKGVGVTETSFLPQSRILESNILVAGAPLATSKETRDKARQVFTRQETADLYGYGSELYRMLMKVMDGVDVNVNLFAFPLTVSATGTKAAQTITVTGTADSTAGILYIRAGGYNARDLVTVSVAKGDVQNTIAANISTAINANPYVPFIATVATNIVTLTAKVSSIAYNDYIVSVNAFEKSELPTTLSATAMSFTVAKTVQSTEKASLTGLINLIVTGATWFTDVVVPYSDDTTLLALDAIVGNPNLKTGLWNDSNFMPCNFHVTNTTVGTAGNTKVQDMASKITSPGFIIYAFPGGYEHHAEVSAYLAGKISSRAQQNPSNSFTNLPVGFVNTGQDLYTDSYDLRDTLYKKGVTPIYTVGNYYGLGDVVSTWLPSGNTDAHLRLIVNQRKVWNIAYDIKQSDNDVSNLNRPILKNAANAASSTRAIDIDMVKSRLATLSGQWENRALIFDSNFTIKNLVVEIDATNPDRFNKTVPVILSGNNRIEKTEILVDRNSKAVNISII